MAKTYLSDQKNTEDSDFGINNTLGRRLLHLIRIPTLSFVVDGYDMTIGTIFLPFNSRAIKSRLIDNIDHFNCNF